MCVIDQGLEYPDGAAMEDAWYELEGAYEVYGIGRNRFVLTHCRTAMHIAIALLVRKRGVPFNDTGIEILVRRLGMPDGLIGSCVDIDRAGEYRIMLKKGNEDQEEAAVILGKTLEVFEWIRGSLGTE